MYYVYTCINDDKICRVYLCIYYVYTYMNAFILYCVYTYMNDKNKHVDYKFIHTWMHSFMYVYT